jgi:hypothetical protein
VLSEEGVDDGNVRDDDALEHGKEDVALSLESDGGSVGRNASASSKARMAAEGRFKGGGDACPVHSTAQHPFQDVMVQRELCSQGGATFVIAHKK